MDLKEIKNFEGPSNVAQECKHWWIATRFHYIDKAVETLLAKPQGLQQQLRVLEFGCGTGQNLFYLRHLSPWRKLMAQLYGVDLNFQNGISVDWLGKQDGLSNQPPTLEYSPNLLLAMDVLEHIEDDFGALNDWKRFMDHESVLMITVPAFQSLWSYHDVLLEHKRRYTRSTLLKVTSQAGLQPIFLNYAFGPFFPLVYLLRKLKGPSHDAQTDLKMPPDLLNEALFWIGKVEAQFGGNPYFGTSLVGFFKKE